MLSTISLSLHFYTFRFIPLTSRLCSADKPKKLLHYAYTHLHPSALPPYRTRLTTKQACHPHITA